MRETLRVGVAQLDPRWDRPDETLDKHLEMVRDAADRGLDLLVFPECSLSGHPTGSVDERAVRRDGEPIAAIAHAARDLTVVFGFVEEAPAAQFYNAAAVVRDGRLLHLHRKLNLATYGNLEEGKHYAQGRYVETVDLVADLWRLGVLICADAWNPALVHLAALHGATLLALPINSAEDGVSSEFSNPQGWQTAAAFYAMIYGLPLLLANRTGTEGGLRFWGGSRIVDPFGETLAQAGDEEILLEATLDYAHLRRARVQLPTVRDSNLGLLAREVRRLESLIGVPRSIRLPEGGLGSASVLPPPLSTTPDPDPDDGDP